MSEFYNFDGSYIRLAGNSPTEFSTVLLSLQAPGRKVKFSYEIDRTVAGELPFVTLDEKFRESAIFAFESNFPVLGAQRPDDPLQYEARLGEIEWGSGLSTTVLSLEAVASGIITLRYVFALDGDPLPLLRSTSALDYNAFILSISNIGPASGEFGPGETIRLNKLDQAQNEDPPGKVESALFGTDATMEGTFGADRLEGADGDDTIIGNASGDTLIGGSGRDKIVGGSGDDTLIADTTLGDTERDKLVGGKGDDILQAGGGNDILIGGPGADRFVFGDGDGKSAIRDFGRGDIIDLSGVPEIRNFKDLSKNHMREKTGNVIIEDGDDLRITLNKTDLSALDAGDFLF